MDRQPQEADLFNDDRPAKSVSALFDADRNSLMTELSGNAIRVHDLLTDEIHNDSTTVAFIGKYENPDPDAVKLKHGHNKDFRPDCKQVVFGLNITADGHVPISFKLFDGNTTDYTTHIPNRNNLRALLGKEDFVYIADCKLCSEENLVHIDDNGGIFITIVPKGRKEVKQFYEFLETNDIEWKDACEIESSRKKGKMIKYKTYEADKTDQGFRIIWIHSSSKAQDDKKRRRKRIDKACKALKELSPKLNAYHLKIKKEIQAAIDKICKGVEDFLPVKIITERKQIKQKFSTLPLSETGGKMATLNAAIKEANDKGNLGLMIYVIPNFPNPDTYQKVLTILQENPFVTIIETTFPVTSCFSKFANQTIQNAHQQAAKFADGLSVLETLQPLQKPTICVLYRETYEMLGYETILQKIKGKIDGLLFEWVFPDIGAYTYSYKRYGIELIQCAKPSMTNQEIAHCLSRAVEEPIVYLVSAAMTGAEIFSAEKIFACAHAVKTYCANAKIVAGFGIRNANDIEILSHIKEIDGVIIGTAFLEVMQQGAASVAAFFDQIALALSKKR